MRRTLIARRVRSLGAVPISDVLAPAGVAPSKQSPATGDVDVRLDVTVAAQNPAHRVIRKLIVGVGMVQQPGAAVSVGTALFQAMLRNSGVEDASVHRTGRRGMGVTRNIRATPAQRRSNPWLASGQEKRWTAPAFQDMGGDWCDRVILGAERPGVRVGLLAPYDVAAVGDAVMHVLMAHRQLSPSDVLIVAPALDADLGTVALRKVADTDPDEVVGRELLDAVYAERFGIPFEYGASDASWLGIGVGGVSTLHSVEDHIARGFDPADALGTALEAPLDPDELAVLTDGPLQLGAYVAALWAEDPATAQAYAARAAQRSSEPTAAMRKSWHEAQRSMPPYRDEAVAHMALTGERPRVLQRNEAGSRIDSVIHKRMKQREHEQRLAHAAREERKPRGGSAAWGDERRRGRDSIPSKKRRFGPSAWGPKGHKKRS